MAKALTLEDINEQSRGKIYTQDYNESSQIEGVKLIELKNYISEEGDFSEVIRLENGEIESLPDFKLAQINRTRLFPGSIKAWHLHLKQDEIWYIPPMEDLFVGLWDIREKSSTNTKTQRVCLGGGKSLLLYIPRGVAHGSANFTKKDVNLFYLVNVGFDKKNPDEMRIPWDSAGADFWKPERD